MHKKIIKERTVVIIDLAKLWVRVIYSVWDVTYNNQVAKLQVPGKTCCLTSNTLHQATVSTEYCASINPWVYFALTDDTTNHM